MSVFERRLFPHRCAGAMNDLDRKHPMFPMIAFATGADHRRRRNVFVSI